MSSNETVKVQTWGKGQGEFVVINANDFDAKKHKRYEPKQESKVVKK